METNFRLLSLNVGMQCNIAGVVDIIRLHKLDIICLQEIRLTDSELESKVASLGFNCKVNIDINDMSKPGTAILWRAALPISDLVNVCECRAQVLIIRQYAVLNIYAPSGSEKKNERATFFSQDIFRTCNLYANSVWIFCGDFNCILSPLDVEEGTGFVQKNCPQLSQLVDVMDLKDVFRAMCPR